MAFAKVLSNSVSPRLRRELLARLSRTIVLICLR